MLKHILNMFKASLILNNFIFMYENIEKFKGFVIRKKGF